MIAARESEDLIRRQLNSEVAVAIRGLQVDIDLAADREKSLSANYDAARARMSRLAENRAEYANLVASVQNRTRLVETARKNLADARARQAGARSASVISRIDGVEAGVWPIGPSRKTITAAGGLGGLFLGFGLIFLFANPIRTSGADAPTASQSLEPSTAVPPRRTIVADDIADHAARGRQQGFGMFHGMTLQEAVRSVQERAQQ